MACLVAGAAGECYIVELETKDNICNGISSGHDDSFFVALEELCAAPVLRM